MKRLLNNLRFRLILLVLLGIIPALLITFASGLEQRRLARLRAQDDAFRYTRLVSGYEDTLADNTRRLLQLVVSDARIQDPQACEPYLSLVNKEYSIYSGISSVAIDGSIVCTSVRDAEAQNVADRSYFQDAISSHEFTIGETTISKLTNRAILPFAMPYFAPDGSLSGIAVAALDMGQVLEYSAGMGLPDQSAMIIVDEQGTVLLRYPESQTWIGQNLPDIPIIHAILNSGGEGSAEAAGVDGVRRLYAFTPSQNAQNPASYISVGIPISIAYAEPDRLLRTNLSLIGLAALLALLVAWFLGDILFLRVVSLTAERDQAEKALQESNAQLEKRVEQRTAELAETNTQLKHELVERQRMVEVLHLQEGELKDLLSRLEQSNRDLQHFAYIASHDLQEPLRKVQAFSERLVKRYSGQLGEDGSDYLERLSSAAGRMQSMINDLLTYSRVSTQGSEFRRVDLQQVVDAVLSDLEIRLLETSGQVLVGDLAVLDADPVQMHQLLQNLIGNALKFHRPGIPPLVQVSACVLEPDSERPFRQVEISIQDNGIGFDEKYLNRIFLPFQRLHSRDEYDGSGIGLAVCRRIVDRHHGEIKASSTTDSGSVFVITLPAHQSTREKEVKDVRTQQR
jgi:signal transduction histidine kinase